MFAQNTRSRFEVLSSDQSSEKGTFDSSYDFLHGGLQEKKTTYATRAEASPQPYEKAQAHRSPGNGINQFDLCCRTGFSRKKCAYYPPFGTHVF